MEPKTCGGCGEELGSGDEVYAVKSGYIDNKGKLVITKDQTPQLFHIGRIPDCMNSHD